MKAEELRKMSIKQLEKNLLEKKAHLQELRFKLSAGKLKNPHQIEETKRTIARILTVLNKKVKESNQK